MDIKGNTGREKFAFLTLTLILTFIFNNIADKGLNYIMNFDNQTIYTYNYSFGIFGLLLVIPAAVLSIWIINGLHSLRSILLHSQLVDKIGLSRYLIKKEAFYKNKSNGSSRVSSRNSNNKKGLQAAVHGRPPKSKKLTLPISQECKLRHNGRPKKARRS